MVHEITWNPGWNSNHWMFTWYILKDAATGLTTTFHLKYQEICYGFEDQFWFRIGAVTRNMAHVRAWIWWNTNHWMFGLTTVFYLNFVYSLKISVSSRAAGLNKSCLNENVAMSECNSSYRFSDINFVLSSLKVWLAVAVVNVWSVVTGLKETL